MVRGGVNENVAFEQRHAGGEGEGRADTGARMFQAAGMAVPRVLRQEMLEEQTILLEPSDPVKEYLVQ